MIDFLRSIFNSSHRIDTTNRQDYEKDITLGKEVISENEEVCEQSGTDKEIEAFVSAFGELHTGETVEVNLHDLLNVIPRDRKKTDAFKGFKSKLKKDRGVDLVITSKSNKK